MHSFDKRHRGNIVGQSNSFTVSFTAKIVISHMNRPNIILTGFMGSGKTTVGKLLARRLDYRFVDTDQLIEERSGLTIPEIFRQKGESFFRALETEIARELATGQGMVISTGGKLMLDAVNAEVLAAGGRVFCLIASPEETLKRVSMDSAHKRPLLDTADPLNSIVNLLRERQEGYGQFCKINTTGKSPEEVENDILAIFADDPPPAPPTCQKNTSVTS